MDLSAKLHELMRREGERPADGARRTGVKPTTFNELANGKAKNPTPGTLRKIAEGYGVTVDWLTSDAVVADSFDISEVQENLDYLDSELRRSVGAELRYASLARFAVNRARQREYSQEGLFMVLDWAVGKIATLEGRVEELRRQLVERDTARGEDDST